MVLYDIGVNGIGQGRQQGQILIDDLREDETVLDLMHKMKAYLRCPIQQQILINVTSSWIPRRQNEYLTEGLLRSHIPDWDKGLRPIVIELYCPNMYP